MAKGGSTRRTGTKVSAKKLNVNTSGKSHKTVNLGAGLGSGKSTSKIGDSK